MKVGIVIVCYNLSIEIFLLQMKAIAKFCKDEYEILIVDNSTDGDKAEQIRYHSELLGINYTKTFSTSRNSSDSHCWASNFAYHKFKDQFHYLFFLDHDAIPIREFSVEQILSGGHVAAGLGQGAKKTYFWAGLVMMAMERIDKDIVDFSTNSTYGLDTGGNLYKIVDQYGKENCIFFNESYHQNPYYSKPPYTHYAMLMDGGIMHMVASSGWAEPGGNQERINTLINIAREKTGISD